VIVLDINKLHKLHPGQSTLLLHSVVQQLLLMRPALDADNNKYKEHALTPKTTLLNTFG
jgi:hypothetical protein